VDKRLIELYLQRGRLRERIGFQRMHLARELAPLGGALQLMDRSRAVVKQALQWLKTNPAMLSALIVGVLVWRPRTVFRSLRWGYAAWRRWRQMRHWMQSR